MEYTFRIKPAGNKRLKIGFLDENLNDDYHSQIMMGISKAAKELDIDFIRFGYYSSHIAYKFSHQVSMILDHIEQYDLDGLLFLGWTRAGAMYNYKNFTKRFSSIPLLSIATEYDNIPSVIFMGNYHIHEMTLHLIREHNLKRIAYIEHFRPDNRNEAYIGAMKEHSLYDPRLFVGSKDLRGNMTPGRSVRALEILLDERKLEPDAIISLNNTETLAIMDELKRRGICVPKDMAVVSYEETETWKYTSPGITTVYFPWMELGYNACMRLAELLKNGHIPHITSVPGKFLFRDSCGCTPHSIEIADAPDVRAACRSLNGITGSDRELILEELEKRFPETNVDFAVLLDSFLRACGGRDGPGFLLELCSQFRKVSHISYSFNLEDIVSHFRRLVLPYLVGDEALLIWAGTLFQQSQVLACERTSAIQGYEMVQAKIIDQNLQEISQELIANFNLQILIDALERHIHKLNIKTCRIFVSNSIFKDEDNTGDIFQDCILVFDYRNGVRRDTGASAPSTARKLLSELFSENGPASTSLAYLLHVTDEIMGFALFEPGPMDERIYQMLSTHISTAMRGSVLLSKLDSSYKKLVEHAQREGMADIAADILHNIGNILNSISVSAHMMENSVKSAPFDDLLRANRLLEANMERLEDFIRNDRKGKILMRFYLKLGESMEKLREQLIYNANRLSTKLNSINEIIAAQQNYAGVASQPEELSIAAILEDALKVHAASLDKYRITVERDYRANPRLVVQRAKLFYIFVNLINNARDSMTETPLNERRLSISIYEDGSESCVRISDTGRGIAEGAIDKVFDYGYSVKDERRGFGLHSSSSYMAEMGGVILAESAGIGKGQAFTVVFRR
jgi:DNA-binding LacI/PurR family transcriptional regulator/signal transduction histidine kinase